MVNYLKSVQTFSVFRNHLGMLLFAYLQKEKSQPFNPPDRGGAAAGDLSR